MVAAATDRIDLITFARLSGAPNRELHLLSSALAAFAAGSSIDNQFHPQIGGSRLHHHPLVVVVVVDLSCTKEQARRESRQRGCS